MRGILCLTIGAIIAGGLLAGCESDEQFERDLEIRRLQRELDKEAKPPRKPPGRCWGLYSYQPVGGGAWTFVLLDCDHWPHTEREVLAAKRKFDSVEALTAEIAKLPKGNILWLDSPGKLTGEAGATFFLPHRDTIDKVGYAADKRQIKLYIEKRLDQMPPR